MHEEYSNPLIMSIYITWSGTPVHSSKWMPPRQSQCLVNGFFVLFWFFSFLFSSSQVVPSKKKYCCNQVTVSVIKLFSLAV